MLGTNDIKKKYGPPSAEKISEGMRKIIDTAITANIGKAFVLISPPPMGTPRTDEFHPGCFIMDQVSYEYRKLAEKYDLTCIDLQRQLEVHRHLQKDTIHLNAEGRLQVAKIVQNTLFR
jgi:lysophospholipase L1-like esterase